MANEVVITVSGKDQFSATADKVKGSAGGMGKALGDVSKIAGGFVIGQGLAAAPGFLMSAAKAAADDAASVSKLKQAVENGGQSWTVYKGKLEDVIEAGQRKGFTDDDTRDALSLLIAQTGSAEEATRRYGLAQDLARGANIDVVTASKLLGKVTDENVNVLGRYGISVQKGASETELFGAIQQKFGGQAETFAKSSAGQMEAAEIQMTELKETLGSALLPVMGAVSKAMLDVAGVIQADIIPAVKEWYQKHQPEIQAAMEEFTDFIDSDLIPTVEAIVEAFRTVWPEIEPIVKIVLAIIENHIITTLKIIRDILVIVMAVIRGDWGAAWDGIKQLAADALEGLVTDVGLKMQLALSVVKFVGQLIVNWFAALGGMILEAIGDLKTLLYDVGTDILQGLKDGLESKWEDVKGWLADRAEQIKDIFKKGLGIESPSKDMIPIGAAIIEGLQVGLQDQEPALFAQIRALGDAMQAAVDDAAPTFSDHVPENYRSVNVEDHRNDPRGTKVGQGSKVGEPGTEPDGFSSGQYTAAEKHWINAVARNKGESEPFPGFLTGGRVTKTGLALVHQDEVITPAGKAPLGNTTITVYIQENHMDGDATAGIAALAAGVA